MLFVVASTIACATWAGSVNLAAQATSAKKGLGEWGQPYADLTLTDARVAWYYDWQPRSDVPRPPPGIQFVPMIWGGKNLNPRDEADAKRTGAGILLTFNEPDNPGQSHMTVAEALTAWPQLEALGMTLGSPAVAEDPTKPNGWLAQFMAGAKASGYRVDFICVHAYQSNFNPEAATERLVKTLQTVYSLYHLPIWLTEYAMASWPGNRTLTPDFATQAAFARVSAPALESLPFLQRYAWYVDSPNQRTWSAYKPDGSETVVGAAWKLAPSRKPR